MRSTLSFVLSLTGVTAFIFGAFTIYPPTAYLIGGAFLLRAAWVIEEGST
jgi:hypothetical protein